MRCFVACGVDDVTAKGDVFVHTARTHVPYRDTHTLNVKCSVLLYCEDFHINAFRDEDYQEMSS